MVKTYTVFYEIHHGPHPYTEHFIYIAARNKREACEKCRETVGKEQNRYAFRPMALDDRADDFGARYKEWSRAPYSVRARGVENLIKEAGNGR